MAQLTREEMVIEAQPFLRELKEWCHAHPEFMAALKPIYSDRFISLLAVATSYSPLHPEDQVIGIYVYDYRQKNPMFKQDFIVNVGGTNTEFILYTRHQSSRYVKDINDFFRIYGQVDGVDKYYINQHRLDLDQLPEELRPRALQAKALAGKMIAGGGLGQMTAEALAEANRKIEEFRMTGQIT